MARFLKMRIKIKDDAADIERKIAKAVSQEFNRKISTGVNNIERDIKSLARDLLSVSPEIQSLRNGELRGAFGIPKEIDATVEIVEAIVQSLDENHTIVSGGRGGLRGGLTIEAQPADFSNLLSLPNSKVVTKKGATLPWLQWLLALGDNIIITEYEVDYEDGSGRSGLASMSKGGTFRVNPSFSGTVEDNFITRAFKGSENRITRIIKRHIG